MAVTPPKSAPSVARVLGVGDLVTRLAECCHPVPGDNIIGYVTRSRGVTIHRQDCHSVISEDEPERLIPTEWGKTSAAYPVNIEVQAWDRVGLMHDITAIVSEEKVNISAISLTHHAGHTTSIFFTFEVVGLAELSRLLVKIEGIRGVTSVFRIGGESTARADSP